MTHIHLGVYESCAQVYALYIPPALSMGTPTHHSTYSYKFDACHDNWDMNISSVEATQT